MSKILLFLFHQNVVEITYKNITNYKECKFNSILPQATSSSLKLKLTFTGRLTRLQDASS